MPRNCLQRHSFDGRPKNDWYLEVSDCLWLPTFFLCVGVCVCVWNKKKRSSLISHALFCQCRVRRNNAALSSLSRASSVPSSLSIESTQTSILFTQTCLAENCIALAFTERFPHTPLSLRGGVNTLRSISRRCAARGLFQTEL